MDRDKMINLYKGPSIDASYQVSVHLAEGFQRFSNSSGTTVPIFSSPCQRQSELLPPLGIRRPSSVVIITYLYENLSWQ
jgi:hypothetical protein